MYPLIQADRCIASNIVRKESKIKSLESNNNVKAHISDVCWTQAYNTMIGWIGIRSWLNPCCDSKTDIIQWNKGCQYSLWYGCIEQNCLANVSSIKNRKVS